MTFRTWSTVVSQATDADFRTWGVEFESYLVQVGLVQTADTGQINWTTVVRAGVGTEAGYSMFSFTDSIGTLYFRFGYGSGGATTIPRIQVAVGQGTNGAGTLTGISSATTTVTGSAITSTSTLYTSYMCMVNGVFWFMWKIGTGGSANANRGGFVFQRSFTSLGVVDGAGGYASWGAYSAATSGLQYFGYSSGTAYAAHTITSSYPCVIPGRVTSSSVGANYQVYLHWLAVPDVRPCVGSCTAIASEVSFGNQFTLAPCGNVSHNYICLGQAAIAETTAQSTIYSLCLIWE